LTKIERGIFYLPTTHVKAWDQSPRNSEASTSWTRTALRSVPKSLPKAYIYIHVLLI